MPHDVALLDRGKDRRSSLVPDAPACTAMGTDADAAIVTAATALSEWMADDVADGRARPPARGLEALRANATTDADLASRSGFLARAARHKIAEQR